MRIKRAVTFLAIVACMAYGVIFNTRTFDFLNKSSRTYKQASVEPTTRRLPVKEPVVSAPKSPDSITDKATRPSPVDSITLGIKRDMVTSGNGTFFIFGVTGVNSTPDAAWDQFRVVGQRYSTSNDRAVRLRCCMRYGDGAVDGRAAHQDRAFYSTGKVPLPLFNVVCHNPRHSQSGEAGQFSIPNGVSVVYEQQLCNSSSVRYLAPYLAVRQRDDSLAITPKISHGSFDPDLLIAWLETYLWLGADKIVTYALSNVTAPYRKVLQYYWQRGVLDVFQYELPGLDAVPRSLPRQWRQTWTDAAVPMFDAEARYSGYTYFSVIDLDEFIVPSGNRTLKQFLNDTFNQHQGAAGVEFRTKFYITSARPRPHQDTFLQRFVDRVRAPPRFDRRKIIFKPTLAHLAYDHEIRPVQEYTVLRCKSSDAFLRHYRYCLPKDNAGSQCLKAAELDLVTDTEMALWSDRIVVNIRRAKHAIFTADQ